MALHIRRAFGTLRLDPFGEVAAELVVGIVAFELFDHPVHEAAQFLLGVLRADAEGEAVPDFPEIALEGGGDRGVEQVVGVVAVVQEPRQLRLTRKPDRALEEFQLRGVFEFEEPDDSLAVVHPRFRFLEIERLADAFALVAQCRIGGFAVAVGQFHFEGEGLQAGPRGTAGGGVILRSGDRAAQAGTLLNRGRDFAVKLDDFTVAVEFGELHGQVFGEPDVVEIGGRDRFAQVVAQIFSQSRRERLLGEDRAGLHCFTEGGDRLRDRAGGLPDRFGQCADHQFDLLRQVAGDQPVERMAGQQVQLVGGNVKREPVLRLTRRERVAQPERLAGKGERIGVIALFPLPELLLHRILRRDGVILRIIADQFLQ